MIPYSSFHSCYHKIKPLVRDLLRISYAIQLTLSFSHFCFPIIIITIVNRVHQGVPLRHAPPCPATCCCGCSVSNGPLQPPSAGY